MWKDYWQGPFRCPLAQQPSDVKQETVFEAKKSSLIVYSSGATKRPENFKFDLKASIIQLQPQMFPIRAIDLRQNDQWTVG